LRPKRRRIHFNVQADPGSAVFVAGDFNTWDPRKKALTDRSGGGRFTGCVLLEPGRYEYKLVINDTWCLDPVCGDRVENPCGTLNNVLHVEQTARRTA